MRIVSTLPNRNGFTLIELLIVVAIIAILAAIAVPNFLEAQTRSKVSRVKNDMRTLATALEAYVVDNNRYPGDQDNNPLHASERGFYRLTTPIAYITTLASDPFSPPVHSGNPNNPNVAAFYVLACGDDNPPTRQQSRSYVIISLGPDQDDSSDNQDQWPAASFLGMYDPTNGAISDGDILRFGGDYQRGFYRLGGTYKTEAGILWHQWNLGTSVP
jgi:type II secretion system protein G